MREEKEDKNKRANNQVINLNYINIIAKYRQLARVTCKILILEKTIKYIRKENWRDDQRQYQNKWSKNPEC